MSLDAPSGGPGGCRHEPAVQCPGCGTWHSWEELAADATCRGCTRDLSDVRDRGPGGDNR